METNCKTLFFSLPGQPPHDVSVRIRFSAHAAPCIIYTAVDGLKGGSVQVRHFLHEPAKRRLPGLALHATLTSPADGLDRHVGLRMSQALPETRIRHCGSAVASRHWKEMKLVGLLSCWYEAVISRDQAVIDRLRFNEGDDL